VGLEPTILLSIPLLKEEEVPFELELIVNLKKKKRAYDEQTVLEQ
jgi:hypothetical protein